MTADAVSEINPEIVFVVAVAENGIIGRDNALPWRLKSDLQRLKKMTIGKPVVMGRKTFASIGRPLPDRTNIVITRDRSFKADGIVVAASLAEARNLAIEDALRRNVTEIMVLGGAEIFKQWMEFADRLEVTEVHARPDGDTRLDLVDAAKWQEVARERHAKAEGESADYSYVTYRRRARH
ncbi:MAG: dihydrofolate reductase [Rhizobiales bacterium]|nr:dihydrofolate reductase [Hyphomicrobiales bacterium]